MGMDIDESIFQMAMPVGGCAFTITIMALVLRRKFSRSTRARTDVHITSGNPVLSSTTFSQSTGAYNMDLNPAAAAAAAEGKL